MILLKEEGSGFESSSVCDHDRGGYGCVNLKACLYRNDHVYGDDDGDGDGGGYRGGRHGGRKLLT